MRMKDGLILLVLIAVAQLWVNGPEWVEAVSGYKDATGRYDTVKVEQGKHSEVSHAHFDSAGIDSLTAEDVWMNNVTINGTFVGGATGTVMRDSLDLTTRYIYVLQSFSGGVSAQSYKDAAGTTLSATFSEANSALDGISVNVTAANLSELTGAGATTLHSHGGGGMANNDTTDTLIVNEYLNAKDAVSVFESVSVGASWSDASTPSVVKQNNAAGHIRYINDTIDTMYVHGSGNGSVSAAYWLILGAPDNWNSDGKDFIALDGENSRIGMGVRNPSYDFEISGGDVLIGASQRNQGETVGMRYYFDAGVNSENFWNLYYAKGSTNGDTIVAAQFVQQNGTSPNTGAGWGWQIKDEGDNARQTVMWISDNATVSINDEDHGSGVNYDWDFQNQNRGDSLLTVYGGTQFVGGTRHQGDIWADDNIRLGTGGDLGGDLCIVFSEGTSPTSNGPALWGESIGAGDLEIWGQDGAGNKAAITANVAVYPEELAVDQIHPYVTQEENAHAGIRTFKATHRAYKILEKMAHDLGYLDPDSLLIAFEEIPVKDWDEMEQSKYDQRELEIANWVTMRDSLAAECTELKKDVGVRFKTDSDCGGMVPDIKEAPLDYVKRPEPAWITKSRAVQGR